MSPDLVALLVIALFGAMGMFSGLLVQVLRLASVVAAVFVALRYQGVAMEAWPSFLADAPEVRPAVFTATIFTLVYLVLSLLSRLVVRVLHRTSRGISTVDRILGAVAGLAKGAVICYFLMALILLVEERAGKELPGIKTEGSWLAAFVKKHPVTNLTELKDIRIIVEPVLKGQMNETKDDR